MRYIRKRNCLVVDAVQWNGNNLPEIWELLEEYREHIGYVGLNFDFMNELPRNLDRYADCILRLIKRGEGETHAVFRGGWILKTVSPEAGNYLFLENEVFVDQFKPQCQKMVDEAFINELKKAGLFTDELLKNNFDARADIRLVAATALYKRGIPLGNGLCHFSDLWELLGDMIQHTELNNFIKLGREPRTFAKIEDLPTSFLKFILKFGMLNEQDIPKEIWSEKKRQIRQLGKLLYKVRVKPHTTDPVLPLQYTRANFRNIASFLVMMAGIWRF